LHGIAYAYALIIGFSMFFFTGCALPLAAIGSASTVATGKSPLEHAASEATKKECNFLNLLGPKPVCQEFVMPRVTDHSQEIIGIADRQAPATTPIPSR
jgi:hypothetical protein